jgi:hypothetical protein
MAARPWRRPFDRLTGMDVFVGEPSMPAKAVKRRKGIRARRQPGVRGGKGVIKNPQARRAALSPGRFIEIVEKFKLLKSRRGCGGAAFESVKHTTCDRFCRTCGF